ncbi:hypothetical protein B0T25DRAFT_541958, partial [Lasiosphaeria hispida]
MADKRTIAQLDRLTLYPATPPDTASPDSPTPSAGLPVSGVDKIIAEIRNRIRGRVEGEEEWWCINLSCDEFKAFEARFEAEVEEDWRWENPKTEGDGSAHHPDGSFAHEDAGVGCVILEVSHSQQRHDLPFLADEYILGSNGRTQVVIGVDLEYRAEKGKEARVTLRRKTGIFRAVDGSLVDGERILRIGLKDFGYWPNCLRIDDIPGEITISFSQLYEIVQQAEARAERWDRERRKIQHENHLKRPRVRSPPQKLTESDEEWFKAAEKRVKRQVSDEDSDYIPE